MDPDHGGGRFGRFPEQSEGRSDRCEYLRGLIAMAAASRVETRGVKRHGGSESQ